jgi:hypothetical protein
MEINNFFRKGVTHKCTEWLYKRMNISVQDVQVHTRTYLDIDLSLLGEINMVYLHICR